MSKYELTISTGYVPDWTYVEAARELFQNAIDNARVNPDNEMSFEYNLGVLSVCNKTSKLTMDSLLIGNSTKRDDKRTIGKHGEGYKIAFMVLLREGKEVTVYNYGANEIWNTRLVKSKRYNGAQVVQIEVNKTPFWAKVPNYDLTIEVSGITEEEFEKIKESNLSLKENVEILKESNFGDLLVDESEKGRVYVEGLYVCTNDKLSYGYNFKSDYVSLDRDRKLVDSFNTYWYSSAIWSDIINSEKLGEQYIDICTNLVESNNVDVYYIEKSSLRNIKVLAERIYDRLESNYGENVVPVSNNAEYEEVKSQGYKPVIVREQIKDIIQKNMPEERAVGIAVTKKDMALAKLRIFKRKVESKLDYAEKSELADIIKFIEDEL